VSDHFQILTEFGSSLVNFHNHASLTRVALAPQLSLNSDIWGRPALRVFYSHSFWNDANKTYIAQNASSFASKNAGGNYGFQVETSF
jgi:maltoporin